MKTDQINIRASKADKALIEKAGKKLHNETGKKPMTSRVIMRSIESYVEHKPDLFFVNRQAIREIDNNIRVGQIMLQEFVNELSACLPGLVICIEDIEPLFGRSRLKLMVADHDRIRDFVIEKLFIKQQANYPGLKFTRDSIDLPDLTKVFLAADSLINIPEVQFREVGLFFGAYLIEGGIVSVIPSKVEQIKDQYRCYAITPDEKQKLTKARALCETLSLFVTDEKFPPERLNIQGICFWDDEAGRFEPVERYVKYTLP